MKSTGFYIEKGLKNQNFIIEWSKLNALSDDFSEKMASLAHLGIESFRSVEIDFLSAYPHAIEEDASLKDFSGLKGLELEDSINARLHKIFHTRPVDLSDEFRSLMDGAYYYLVTIKDESSEKIQGFITFLSGGPIPNDEFKITALAIDKNARRQGLAGFLINFFKKIGLEPKKIFLCTRPSNSIAINAYKKFGFVEDIEAQKSASPYLVSGHWIQLARF